MEGTDTESVRQVNPECARLLDVISSTYQEDGLPKQTRLRLKQAELRLRDAEQKYLEQQLLNSELAEALRSQPRPKASKAAPTKSRDSHVTASAELQHCLELAPEVSLFGLHVDHLKAAVEEGSRNEGSSSVLHQSLVERLQAKCCRVVQWHAPQKDLPSEPALLLARAGQLPHLLTQQREEVERFHEDTERNRKDCQELMAKKHMVLGEMCMELQHALEQYKLTLTKTSNQTGLDYLLAQSQAMLGKLEVMHHQLLKGICAEGRVEALKQIRSHLLTAQRQLTEELSQTQQVILSYHSLGEEFTALSQQYRELQGEIENRQWALRELSKSRT